MAHGTLKNNKTIINKKNVFNYTNSKGVTFISLVMTIAVMLILVAVVSNVIFGNNGFISKTKNSARLYNLNQVQEELQISATNGYVLKYKKGMKDLNIADQMSKEHPEIEWTNKNNLNGKYKGFDFFVVDKNVIVENG